MTRIVSATKPFVSPPEHATYVTQVLETKDPIIHSESVREARAKEINGLVQRDTSKVVKRGTEWIDTLSTLFSVQGGSRISAEFICAIRNSADFCPWHGFFLRLIQCFHKAVRGELRTKSIWSRALFSQRTTREVEPVDARSTPSNFSIASSSGSRKDGRRRWY